MSMEISWEGISAIGGAASAVFAGGSVLWGVENFKKSNRLANIKELRLALTDLRHRAAELDQIASGEQFALVTEHVACALKEQMPTNVGKDELIKFLSDDENMSHIVYAVELGYGRSGIKDRYERIIDKLRVDVFRVRSDFPTLSLLFSQLSSLLELASSSLFRSRMFVKIFEKGEGRDFNIRELEKAAARDPGDGNLVWNELKINLMQPMLASSEDSQKRFTEAQHILNNFIDFVVSLDDNRLLTLSRFDRGLSYTDFEKAKTKVASISRIIDAFRAKMGSSDYVAVSGSLNKLRVLYMDDEQ